MSVGEGQSWLTHFRLPCFSLFSSQAALKQSARHPSMQHGEGAFKAGNRPCNDVMKGWLHGKSLFFMPDSGLEYPSLTSGPFPVTPLLPLTPLPPPPPHHHARPCCHARPSAPRPERVLLIRPPTLTHSLLHHGRSCPKRWRRFPGECTGRDARRRGGRR